MDEIEKKLGDNTLLILDDLMTIVNVDKVSLLNLSNIASRDSDH